ncbi:MAG TPA: hypothetical protein VIJ93_05410 [bacterium]
MIKNIFWILLISILFPTTLSAQEGARPVSLQFDPELDPVEFGIRYDDNVFRSTVVDGRLSDGIYSIDAGGVLGLSYDVFKGRVGYHLGVDQYLFYSSLDNLKNNFDLLLSETAGDFSFYYNKTYFLRTSQDPNFNYFDDDNLFGVQWTPAGQWNYEAKYKNFYRYYYDMNDSFQSRDFVDQAVLLSVQREIDEKFSVKLEGDYDSRQFNRFLVELEPDGSYLKPPIVQDDQTWSLLFNAHFYFDSILQDVNLEEQRTNSNSYGFSNTVQSVSWAAVIQPVPSLYLQLFFRLYSKIYDVPPLVSPDLQVGFVDENSQDLLSIKSSWEWSPQWTASLSVSRVRNESTQPGEFYIKNILAAQVRKSF